MQTRQELLNELEFYLKKEFPNAKIHPFGSMTTSLGGTQSDIDVVVDLYGNLRFELTQITCKRIVLNR
jgi:DNA polymerase sigma